MLEDEITAFSFLFSLFSIIPGIAAAYGLLAFMGSLHSVVLG
jgi:hypothetical protein